MTNTEAKKILESYIACESKKAHFECSEYNCDDSCPLLYEMGTVGEFNEAINMAIQALEQEPCEDTISRQNDILPNIDKEVESYKKLLKHPVIKHIMDMDETQEQLDFVQPHKRIPVTLTVSDDLISRETVCDYIAEFINHEYSTQSECEMVDLMIDGIQHMPSVKPQTGHWIMRHRKVNTINYRTGEDVLTGEIHTVKELIRYECDEPYCSECGKRAGDTSGNYCCFCGARMESEQNG